MREERALSQLLDRLADGEYHSGDELGEILGVSRAAVWKQLRKLNDLGLQLDSVRGKGYCLEGGLERLDQQALVSGLSDKARRALSDLDIYVLTDSTNTRALARASDGESGYVCLAEQQTAGRGRRGRPWVSPFGRNLYLSLTWSFEGGASQLEGLSLAVGAALCRVLEKEGVPGLELKWPNDLLWQGRKLSGVLLEMTGDPAGACQVVVGVGINRVMPGSAMEQVEQPWVDLQTVCERAGIPLPGRNALAAGLIDELLCLLSDYHKEGFAPWRPEWEKRDAFMGRRVRLSSGQRVREGVARGVDVSGALRLEVNGEVECCHGGELSMRAVS